VVQKTGRQVNIIIMIITLAARFPGRRTVCYNEKKRGKERRKSGRRKE
jgi:hypothetical protein